MSKEFHPQTINDLIAESVYGPAGENTQPCANAWEVSKLISQLHERLRALELAQRIHSGTLTPAERAELGLITAPEFKAAMASAARQGADRAMTQMQAGASKTPPLAGTLVEAPDRAGVLVERLAALITSSATSRGAAQDVLREVAAWLRTGRLLHAAELLEQEVDR